MVGADCYTWGEWQIWRMVGKEALKQYIDAQELIRETENAIQKLERQKTQVIADVVRGSSDSFPYQQRTYHVEGVESGKELRLRLRRELLERQQAQAEELELEVITWMLTLPPRMQRIIRLHVFEGLSWEQTATKLGRRATGDSVRQEYNRFMETGKG